MASISASDRVRLLTLLAGHMFRRTSTRLNATPIHRMIWSSGVPRRLALASPDIRTADPTIADDMYAGRYLLADQLVETGGRSPFEIQAPSQAFFEELHGFEWLCHLRAAGTDKAQALARTLIVDWLALYGRYDAAAWQPTITARRLISWLSHSPLILANADAGFYRRVLREIARQTRYLSRVAADARGDATRLTAVVALAFAGLSLQGWERFLRRVNRWLDDELDRQILVDGGHLSRNPSALVDLLIDLLPLRQCYLAREQMPPKGLIRAIDQMMPMLRFFRHADGTLAHFNGMGMTRADLIATLLAYDETRGAPVLDAKRSGYQRLEGGGTTIIMDTGRPPPVQASATAHAGCLSFEMSTESAGRVITNCGAPTRRDTDWARVARTTAAHSTASINDISSCRFATAPWIVRRIGPVVISGPRDVPVERTETGDGTSIVASHDGYGARFGVVHQRRIELSADGRLISGLDAFVPTAGRSPSNSQNRFAIRFHLAPGVRARRTRSGDRVLLQIGREAWAFGADDGDVQIEESIYLCGLHGPRQTEQIVINGRVGLNSRIGWAFERVEIAPRAPARSEDADLDLEDQLATTLFDD